MVMLQSSCFAQEYNIKLNSVELDLIGEGLGTQPYKQAAPLINKLRQQVIEQQQQKKIESVCRDKNDLATCTLKESK